MKKRTKIVLILLGIAVAITVLIVGARIATKAKYEYLDSGYGAGSSLILDDTVYVEIIKDDFDEIKEKLRKKSIEQSTEKFIIKIDYPYIDEIWKYNIHGNKDKETRILLKGCESGFIDTNRPDFYYCRQDILYSYLELTDYQYATDGYTIKGDGITYKEINESVFLEIMDELRKKNIYGFAYRTVGKISDSHEDRWKVILHGNLLQRERILLRGKEEQAFYDEDYPEVYYCREDIYDVYKEHGSLEGIDLREYME